MNPKLLTYFISYRFPLILIAGWVSLQILLLIRFGIVTGFEAVPYIEQANIFLKDGAFTSRNFLFYSTQILLIAFCIKFNISFLFIVFIQMLCNALSLICFFKLLLRLTNNRSISSITTMYFLIFFYYHAYNVYLFTESLYFSFSIIYTFILFTTCSLNLKRLIYILSFLLLLYFTRPTGIFFIPATLLFIFFKFFSQKTRLILIIAALFCIIFLYFLFNFSLGSGGGFDFLYPYIYENIICGVPTIDSPHTIKLPVNSNSIEGLFHIIKNHFNLFLKLSIKRLTAFFGIIRGYYSLPHNLFAGAYFYAMYITILLGLRRIIVDYKPEAIFLFTSIILMTVTVVLSCDEWHNRFILSQLPFFLILTALALSKIKIFSAYK